MFKTDTEVVNEIETTDLEIFKEFVNSIYPTAKIEFIQSNRGNEYDLKCIRTLPNGKTKTSYIEIKMRWTTTTQFNDTICEPNKIRCLQKLYKDDPTEDKDLYLVSYHTDNKIAVIPIDPHKDYSYTNNQANKTTALKDKRMVDKQFVHFQLNDNNTYNFDLSKWYKLKTNN